MQAWQRWSVGSAIEGLNKSVFHTRRRLGPVTALVGMFMLASCADDPKPAEEPVTPMHDEGAKSDASPAPEENATKNFDADGNAAMDGGVDEPAAAAAPEPLQPGGIISSGKHADPVADCRKLKSARARQTCLDRLKRGQK